MQSLFRRCYATLPDTAAKARTSSTPRAVRLRRLRKRPDAAAGNPDLLPSGLTPTEFARYQRALAKGELMGPDGKEPTEEEWLAKLNARRTRLRGTRQVANADGTKDVEVVGQKVYLPNIIFRLMRNHTPRGQAYNPYEATFRVPQSVTKTDVRSYLAAVYGVQTTYIRTDNYISPVDRNWDLSWTRTYPARTYKRAVVGLVEPFYYPDAVEDMSAEERKNRETFIQDVYRPQGQKDAMKLHWLRETKKNSKNWAWRGGLTAQRGSILRKIAEQRALRERFIESTKKDMLESRREARRQAAVPA
ncbi:mitochondrial ribosomal protein L23 [Dentipellis sp. KUC8613]|nr:mitochondrial ribosomal protein L23 [Dentipellis sp. KUC8613]